MIRGSTPKHTFRTKISTALIKSLSIAYAQNGVLVLRKTKSDCSFFENAISVELTQEETLRFSGYSTVEIQLKALDQTNKLIISKIYVVPCKRVLDEEVLV